MQASAAAAANNNTLDLVIVEINFSNKSETTFELYKSNDTATGGTVVTGLNWNFGSSNTANANARRDPTASSVNPVDPIECQWVPDAGSGRFDLHNALILTNGDAIAVRLTKGDDDTCVTIKGYYHG